MNLKTYIRDEQEFLIFMRADGGEWERYDPAKHGSPESLRRGYVVAYLSGEIIENRVNMNHLPPGTHYIEESDGKPELMPPCDDDHSIAIQHEPSAYHRNGKYCTRVRNAGNTPFRVKRFAAFQKAGLLGKYRLSTISNAWFTQAQFIHWLNQKTEWIAPESEVADHDNFGFGNGFWVFEIEYETGKTVTVKTSLPNKMPGHVP